MTQAVAPKPSAVPTGTAGFRPTVLIGLGGLGCRVACSLRRRFYQRFAEPVELASVQIVALDTDRTALRALEAGETGTCLAPDETLCVPLRKSTDYRSTSDEILSWLSRRWLYNIPRSLRTEGLRPLGRLAFVGHREAIADRIAAAVTAVTAEATPQVGGTKDPCPRSASPGVYLVTSIGGGTGGGMLLDVAYTVREQLKEQGLAADHIYGMLLHATFAASPGNDLRTANAYATLTELNHFMQGNADHRAGPLGVLPAGDVSAPPFAGAYLVDLGDDVGQTDFDQALERVVEYLYLNAATACGALLERWHQGEADRLRRLSGESPTSGGTGPVRLRSFGLQARRFSKPMIAARQSDRLCLRVVRKWLGEQEDGPAAYARVQPPDLELTDLVTRLTAVADKALGGCGESHFRALVGPAGPAMGHENEPAGPFGEGLRRIHGVLGMPANTEATPSGQLLPLECELRDGAQKLAAAAARSLVESIREMVERPQGRLPVATTAVSLVQGQLRDLRRSAEEIYRQDHDDAISLWLKLQRGETPRGRTTWFGSFSTAAKQPEDLLVHYCRLRMRAMIHKFVAKLSQDVAAEVASFGDRLGKVRQSVQWLANEFSTAVAAQDANTFARSSSGEGELVDELAPLADKPFVEQFDESLQQAWLEPRGGLMGLAEELADGLRLVQRELHRRGCERVAALLDRVDAWHLLAKANPTDAKLHTAVRSAAEQTSIRLPQKGGAEKLLVLAPRGTKGKVIVEALRDHWPDGFVVPSEEGDLVFCREVEGISLVEAANALITGRDDCAEAARRVLTRVDVSWATLGAE